MNRDPFVAVGDHSTPCRGEFDREARLEGLERLGDELGRTTKMTDGEKEGQYGPATGTSTKYGRAFGGWGERWSPQR